MGGATRAPMCSATRSATATGRTTSVESGRCGPCCSVEPVGRRTMGFAFTRSANSYQVMSAMRKGVAMVVPSSAGPHVAETDEAVNADVGGVAAAVDLVERGPEGLVPGLDSGVVFVEAGHQGAQLGQQGLLVDLRQ